MPRDTPQKGSTRGSPYARPAAQASSTPTRSASGWLSGLSSWSPWRKAASPKEEEQEADSFEQQQGGDHDQLHVDDDEDSSVEMVQVPSNGQLPSSSSNAVLSDFFRSKGNQPLTPIEAAGVMSLLNGAPAQQPWSEIPTAFTPAFGRTSSFLKPSQSQPSFSFASTSKPPTFTAASSVAGSSLGSNNGAGLTSSARKRSLYTGAGSSSSSSSAARRRKSALVAPRSFKSESNLASLASNGPDDGHGSGGHKRARVQEDDRPPTQSLSSSSLLSRPAQPKQSGSGLAPVAGGLTKSTSFGSHLSSFASTSTPVRPSPLSQLAAAAGTPSPSPPKARTGGSGFGAGTIAELASAATPPASPALPKSGSVADLLLSIIAEPSPAPAAAKKASQKEVLDKEAFVNPYDNSPARRPVTRGAAASRRVSGLPGARKSVTPASQAPPPAKKREETPKERLEKSMPVELRPPAVAQSSKRAKPSPSPSAPPMAKKTSEVVELLSSSDEDEEKVEQQLAAKKKQPAAAKFGPASRVGTGAAAGKGGKQSTSLNVTSSTNSKGKTKFLPPSPSPEPSTEEEEEDGSSAEEVAEILKSPKPKTNTSMSFVRSPSPGQTTFNPFATMAAADAAASSAAAAEAAAKKPAFSFGPSSPAPPSKPAFSVAPTPPPPSSSTTSSNVPSTVVDDFEARKAALSTSRAELPKIVLALPALRSGGQGEKEEDAGMKSAKEVVRLMGRQEIGTVRLVPL